jgi:hypothetical protein
MQHHPTAPQQTGECHSLGQIQAILTSLEHQSLRNLGCGGVADKPVISSGAASARPAIQSEDLF